MRPYLPGTAASIGAATAVRLAREGADVAISYVSSAEAADEVVKTIDGPFADEVRSHIALNRYADVTEIAAAICFLVGPDASYVTGTTLTSTVASMREYRGVLPQGAQLDPPIQTRKYK